MNSGNNILDAFVFHDAILNSISFDLHSETITMEIENEIEESNQQLLLVRFKNVDEFSCDFNDFFNISEISSVNITNKNGLLFFEMIVLLGFGKPSGEISFSFSDFEVTSSSP